MTVSKLGPAVPAMEERIIARVTLWQRQTTFEESRWSTGSLVGARWDAQPTPPSWGVLAEEIRCWLTMGSGILAAVVVTE